MRRHFIKMHGSGNDFVIFDEVNSQFSLGPETVRKVSDRHRGIGCDQVLVLEPPRRSESALAYRVFNADGGEVEQCGNGVRCIAWLVAQERGVNATEVSLDSPAGPIEARLERGGLVSVQMGEPRFDPADIPLGAPTRAKRYSLELDGEAVSFGAVSMGNPHAVILVRSLEEAPVERVGRALQRHSSFPAGVNVGFVQIAGRDHVKLRVYERGAGETLACGTAACAAVAVGRDLGKLDPTVSVDLAGGRLMVSWEGPGAPLWLSGPAQRVFEGYIDL